MRNVPIRPLVAALTAFVLVALFSACDGGQPTSVSEEIAASDGGIVSLGDDITLTVPAGALPDDALVSITRATEDSPAPGELEGADPVGPAFDIGLGGQELSEPVTLEIAFDPELLPENSAEEAVFLAYYDNQAEEWIPVGGQVDQERNVVIIETDHLSWWNSFAWNWEAWTASIRETLGLKLSQWVEEVKPLTGECEQSGEHVIVDASKANDVIQGCIAKDDPSNPQLRVVNLKSFFLGISPAPGGPGYPEPTILGPGEATSFTASTDDTPPATVYADFTEAVRWRFLVGLVAQMLPLGDEMPDEGLAFVADGLAKVVSAQEISEDLEAGEIVFAAEATYKLVTSDDSIENFSKLVAEYAEENSIDMMQKWTKAGIRQVLNGVAIVDVSISLWDFIWNHFFSNRSEVAFNWTVPKPSPTPTP